MPRSKISFQTEDALDEIEKSKSNASFDDEPELDSLAYKEPPAEFFQAIKSAKDTQISKMSEGSSKVFKNQKIKLERDDGKY